MSITDQYEKIATIIEDGSEAVEAENTSPRFMDFEVEEINRSHALAIRGGKADRQIVWCTVTVLA